ncbi:MAG: hypothetical protein HAW58_05615, partial [Candidatus Thioglobus sp.]|nr:hypothetical protein [Candidatus Thioglobus sp.]
MLSNSLKILFFTIFTLIVQTTFAASDKSKENLEQEKRITKTIQTLGYFTQIAKSFKHRNNQNATDINQIYEHASGILKDGIYLERNDPWGDKWIFEVKNGVFKVDSINYKKYRETQALAAENIIKDPYADSNFGAELAATQTIFASDEETDKPRKRNRRRGQQYDCEGLLIENNQISTDCRRIFFEKGAKFAEQISATKYYSNDNFVETVSFLPTFSAHYSGDKYELDFSENSEIEILNIAKIADSESDEFALDPTEITTLNELTVEKLKDFSGENLKNLIANSVNNSIVVTLRTLPDLAVVRGDTLDSGGNIKLVIDGRDSNIGSVLVGTTDSQTYQSFSTSGDLSADSIQVGTITNTFNTGEHSLLVGGDIAVRGDIYTNEQLTISGQTITDEITSSGAIKIQTGNVNFVNSIDDSGVNISTDSGANLNISASQISFKANRNKADGYRFNNASGEAVFAIDTQNQRVGIGEISTATLTVANGGIVNVNSLGVDSPLTINTTAKGKLLPLEFNGQDISWYGVIGDGAPTISDAGIGSLAFESGTGSLYVKNPAAWQLLPLDQDSIHNGGDNTTATLFVGTNDNNALEIITNNEIALKLDADQNASFFGNISLNNKNISGVSELKISTLKPQNGTLTISLKDAQTNALRITDGSTDLLNFNTNAGAKSITVGADLKLGGNQISGSNFDING